MVQVNQIILERMICEFEYLFIYYIRQESQANPNSANALNLRDAAMKQPETEKPLTFLYTSN